MTSGIIAKQHKQKKLINNLQNKLELNEDEKIQYKIKIRRYKSYVGNLKEQIVKLGHEPILTDDISETPKKQVKEKKDYGEIEKKFNEAVEENDALRKGMHELLESIRSKNGNICISF